MHTSQVDLPALAQKVRASAPLDEQEKRVVDRIIWSYGQPAIGHCDFIMVLGNPTCVQLRLPAALRLWRQHASARLVLCGGVVMPDAGITEAEGMRKACLAAGVPPEQIILEDRSTITRENVTFAAPLICAAGVPRPVIAAVSSPTHMRRVQMNFDRFIGLYPQGTSFIPYASDVQGFSRDNWRSDRQMVQDTATELGFIHEYIYELGYAHFGF